MLHHSRSILLLLNSRIVRRRKNCGGLWLSSQGLGCVPVYSGPVARLGGSLPPMLVVCFRWVAGGWRCNSARVCCSGGGDAG